MEFESMAQRHTFILKKLKQEESIKVADLAESLKVSLVTIRKDLKVLENKGLLFRSHGSITKNDPYTQDINVTEKWQYNQEEKLKIGAAAASLVKPNDAILIASGTTVLQMAHALEQTEGRLTVVTSAMNIALALRNRPNTEIILLGGIMRHSSASVVGHYAENMLKQLSFSTLFLGVDGIEENYGCSTSNMLEAQLNKAMIQAAQKTVILTDSSKFGKKGFGQICELDEIDQIITDKKVSKNAIKVIETHGIELTLV